MEEKRLIPKLIMDASLTFAWVIWILFLFSQLNLMQLEGQNNNSKSI